MTIIEKAEQIAKNGMDKKEVFKFFGKVNRDIVDYITIFGMFNVSQKTTWDLYEEWQES